MKHYNSFCKLCKEQNSRVYHTGDGRGRGASRTPLSKWIWAEVGFPGWVKGPDVRWNLWLIKPVRSEIKIGEVSRDCLLSWVTCCSVAQLCLTLCDPLDCSPPGFLVPHHPSRTPKFMSIESVMPSNHLILYYPLLFLPSIFSSIRVFSESAVHVRWPRNWSFSFSISPSSEYSGLISFKIDWFDLHAFQGTLKSLLQHHNSKASILWHSAFFMVQLAHPHMTTGKTIAFTRQTFVGKVMSLLFNMLSTLVITFLPRSNRLLISWLESPSAVIFEPKKIVCHCFHCFHTYLP